MSTLQEKMKEYQKKGARELDSDFPPTAMLTNDENKEQYLEGKLLGRSMVITSYGKSPVYTVEFISADCPIRTKINKEWVDADVPAGDVVAFFAPRRLDTVLRKCKVGDQVVIGYTGREDKKKAKGKNPAHLFVVQNLGGGSQPIATAAEVAAAESTEKTEEEF